MLADTVFGRHTHINVLTLDRRSSVAMHRTTFRGIAARFMFALNYNLLVFLGIRPTQCPQYIIRKKRAARRDSSPSVLFSFGERARNLY